MSRQRSYLVAYDIANPRRLQRVARCVSRYGVRAQYSVFLAKLSVSQKQTLMVELRQLIDPLADDVRLYPLPTKADIVCYGRSPWPEGVQLFDDRILTLTPQVMPLMVAGDRKRSKP